MSRGGIAKRAAVVLFALGLVLVAGCRQGHRPDTAAVPVGPSSGAVGVSYTFSSSAEDHDGDDVAIRFDWGDGDTSDWSDWIRPGDTVAMTHKWASPGTFSIKAQAKARNFTFSGWSDGCTFAVLRTFAKTFGGARNDWGNSVQQTQDGGYVVGGTTWSHGAGGADFWLVKTDADGNEVWDKSFGGTGDDEGYSVQQTQDGGYIIVGSTKSYGAGGEDVWLVRTDQSGNLVWDRTFGGEDADWGESVRQTLDGGYIMCGTTWSYGAGFSDIWLIKTDSNGDTVWTRTFGGQFGELGHSVQLTRDGGYVAAGRGYFRSCYVDDIQLVRVDASGNEVWYQTFGGASFDGARSVQQTQDGGFVIGGYTESYGSGSRDAWVLKTNANGVEVWNRTYGGTFYDECGSVYQTQDGGYVLTGSSDRGSGYPDLWLIRTDANGDTVWTRTFGGNGEDAGNSVQQTQDGGYIVAGTTESHGAGRSDAWLIKTDAEGNVDEGQGKDGFRVQKSETRMQNEPGK